VILAAAHNFSNLLKAPRILHAEWRLLFLR
jgi:hypothetical protein